MGDHADDGFDASANWDGGNDLRDYQEESEQGDFKNDEWMCSGGRVLKIANMETEHLSRCVGYLRRKGRTQEQGVAGKYRNMLRELACRQLSEPKSEGERG